MPLERLLNRCVQLGASDLHIASGLPPYFRVEGTLQPDGEFPALAAQQVEIWARQLAKVEVGSPLRETGDLDGAFTSLNGTRFRYNLYRRSGELNIALRRLDDHFRTLRELGLPESLTRLCHQRYGLVIVAGPTGSGKSTTLATLIDTINRHRQCHIVTIEDPVEYLHTSQRALVNQRQLGLDASTFADALVAAMRQDPDVILVGEIRDLATIRTAITAAETGHLVFTTVHAGDCVGAIERIVSVFPAGEQEGVRRQLSLVLRAIIAQHLLIADGPAEASVLAAGEGRGPEPFRRVLAAEVLVANSAVANLIASAKSNLIYSVIESGGASGMQTIEQSLAELHSKGAISPETVAALSRQPSQVFERSAKLQKKRGAVSTR